MRCYDKAVLLMYYLKKSTVYKFDLIKIVGMYYYICSNMCICRLTICYLKNGLHMLHLRYIMLEHVNHRCLGKIYIISHLKSKFPK